MLLFKKPQTIGLDELEIQENKMFVRKNVDKLEANARVIVEETHTAVLIKDGKLQDTLSAGAYPLFDTKKVFFHNIKIGANTISLIYMSKTAEMKGKWGTPVPFDFRDPVADVPISVGASGEYGIRIYDPRQFYLNVIGAIKDCTVEALAARLRERIVNEIKPALAKQMIEKKLSYYNLAENTKDVSDGILPVFQDMLRREYGLDMTYFLISNIMIKPEDKKKIEAVLEKRKEKLETRDDYRWWVAEYERLADRQFEREKLMRELESQDYAKYLKVCEVVGWKGDGQKGKGGMFCTHCGAPYTATDKFCGKCGHKVGDWKVVCPSCGHENSSGNQFCASCGKKL